TSSRRLLEMFGVSVVGATETPNICPQRSCPALPGAPRPGVGPGTAQCPTSKRPLRRRLAPRAPGVGSAPPSTQGACVGPGGRWFAYSFIEMHNSSESKEAYSMGIRVAVAGASGYAGGELLRLLAGHPDLEIGAVTGASSAGKPLTEVHPNLTGHPAFDGKTFEATDPDLLASAELVFMALPHGESAALAGKLAHARIVDLSADFRLGDEAAWQQFYGTDYAGRWAYGLPELHGARQQIADSTRVAAPGCYATASILALAPLLAAGLADPKD